MYGEQADKSVCKMLLCRTGYLHGVALVCFGGGTGMGRGKKKKKKRGGGAAGFCLT